MITGTKLKRAVSKQKWVKENLAIELLAELLSEEEEENDYKNSHMIRGDVVEEIIQNKENMEEVGFLMPDNDDFIWISPDWIQKNENMEIIKWYEIKGPSAKNQIKWILDGTLPADYYWQVIHYFVVCDKMKEVDFIFWNWEMKVWNLKMQTINIKREQVEDSITQAKANIEMVREILNNYKEELQQKFS